MGGSAQKHEPLSPSRMERSRRDRIQQLQEKRSRTVQVKDFEDDLD